MSNKVNLVLCWHMHQPYYRDGLEGSYRLPWVYLHGIKDYDDMAAHLERHPGMKAVVNFAPVLLEQLDDYAQQLDLFLTEGKVMNDPMLNWLAGATAVPDDQDGRLELVMNCRRSHAPRMVDPYPPYRALLGNFSDLHQEQLDETHSLLLDYLNEQYFLDLLTWYHLAWTSYALKQTPVIKSLMEKQGGYDLEDRRALLGAMRDTLASLIPRYRALAERGQVELSMTPYGHPIVPLLNDFENMRDAQPDAPAPRYDHYPDGKQRSRWHLEEGLRVFQHYFKRSPQGVWLSEGGVSDDAIALLDEMNIKWTASGEAVWHHSCQLPACDPKEKEHRKALFRPYQLKDFQTRLFFRDDGLSDMIGFEYSKWHADDAVADFLKHLGNISSSLGDDAGQHVISVILDGENAWEYYPDNGHHFLDTLYGSLVESEIVQVNTFAEASSPVMQEPLDHLVAGSWVYGSFSTWIGSEDKNRGWELLVEAKQAYDNVIASGELTTGEQERADHMLAVCEGSDWFWWFGDYNSADSVSDFDRLYRRQLKTLYGLLKLPAPAVLDTPLSKGGGSMENAGTMRRNS